MSMKTADSIDFKVLLQKKKKKKKQKKEKENYHAKTFFIRKT